MEEKYLEALNAKLDAVMGLTAALFRRNQLATSLYLRMDNMKMSAITGTDLKEDSEQALKLTHGLMDLDKNCEDLLSRIEEYVRPKENSDAETPEDPEWPDNLWRM